MTIVEIFDLNITDASNTGRWPEGMAPSAVNNAGRADEGLLARWHEDTNGSVASTGSANAYLFAAKQTLSAYYDGLTITFDANFTNTGAATLNVDSVSVDAIVWPDGVALIGDEIISGAKITVRHDGTNWQLVAGGFKRPTAQAETATTSGTSVDITSGIDANAKRVTIMFDGVSTNGTSLPQIQLGDSGGFETSGYLARVTNSAADNQAVTTGFGLSGTFAAAATLNGFLVLVLMDATNNTWLAGGNLNQGVGSADVQNISGIKSLSSALTQIRLTTTGGVNTFDAGAFNIIVE